MAGEGSMGKADRIPIIGLEIHVELKTVSKMFCGCPADHFGKQPNTQTCPVCLGLPGALPVPQKKAVDWTIMIGLGLNCTIARESKFDRKHYFYPDLPKGYQISQYDEPLCYQGSIETSSGRIRITRVHLEEDTGKLLHKKVNGRDVTLVDFNRSGVPLVEIVTEPDIRCASQAKELAQKLRTILRYLGVSDCDMEKGSMRIEANVSVASTPQELPDYKVEIKNINSFRFLEKAIEQELVRQRAILEKGEKPKQETRGWDETRGTTRPQRYKETAADYRYFPEPDIPPMVFDPKDVARLKEKLPEMPDQVVSRWLKEFSVRRDYADLLVADRPTMQFVERAFLVAAKSSVPINTVAGEIVNRRLDPEKTSPSELVSKLSARREDKVKSETELEGWIDQAIDALPRAVQDYQRGKTGAIAALIGKVMQLSGGKADATAVRRMIEAKLKT